MQNTKRRSFDSGDYFTCEFWSLTDCAYLSHGALKGLGKLL